MRSSKFLRDLEARGLVADVTGREELEAHLGQGSRVVYCGFDPTADSLHIGSLLPLLALRRFQLADHRPIVLIGGGTGLIGDPSGKTGERPLNPADQVEAWAGRLKRQVARFLDFEAGAGGARLLDNFTWLSRLDVIAFLRDVGKEFPVGAMLARESVRSRLGRAEVGLSYTEFSYQILQAYDFLELWRAEGCTLQIGGADQWGNITAGIELIRRKTGGTAFGLTLPLVTRSDGGKFGKTEAGTVWLDAAKTSAYEMYQFWLNTADADVDRFLKYFTFLSLDEIADLSEATARAPEKRAAQRVLAREATRLIHGEGGLREAEAITEALFTGDVAALTEEQLAQAFREVPTTRFASQAGLTLMDVLLRTGLAASRRAGRELLANGAIVVNGRRVTDPAAAVSPDVALHGRYLVLRKGKRTYHLVTIGNEVGAGGE
ncbi:MAG TPA: tyrosine--tRNA ligase [Methylomirabilota bacterium]|nr:tyrosine--tRNA ligase [Methylomirabilota bacterium]